MATIYQVAEHAGVSLSTVSRVLNGKATVNATMREKVQKAVQELNYRPSAAARSLASNRSNSIGVYISSFDMPHFSEFLQSLEASLRAADKHIIIAGGANTPAEETIEFLINKNCDALIIHNESISDHELAALHEKPIPLVIVNRQIEGMAQNSVCLGNEQGAYLATTHLIELGHRNIAYVGGPTAIHHNNQRLAGYQRGLDEAGIPRNPALVFTGDNDEEGGNDGLLELLSRDVSFSALVCANDKLASGAIQCAKELGMDLPDDLSIVGFNDEPFATHLFPPLTTVGTAYKEVAQQASRLILKNVYNQQPDMGAEVEPDILPSLIIRGSTRLYEGD